MEALKRSSVAASNGREITKKNRSQEILMSQDVSRLQGLLTWHDAKSWLLIGSKHEWPSGEVQTLKVRLHLLVATPADQIAPSTTATS